MKLKIISQSDVKQSVNMAQAIDAVKQAYVQMSQEKAVVPQRIQVPVKKQEGITFFMPAYLAANDSLGVKIVSVFPENLKCCLPTVNAVVIVINAKTGRAEAIIDGNYLTALRTGAASGVATDLLARKNSRVAAIFGAGIQGRTQLEAVCTVRFIEKAWIYDREIESAKNYVKELKSRGKPFPHELFVARSPAQAVKDADIICTATTSFSPVFEDTDLKDGVHINGIGSYTPEMQEVPAHTVARARVIVDSLSAALSEAGDLIIPLNEKKITKSHIQGEIGQVAAGQIPGRQSDKELTFFKSVGIASQDVAVGELILRNTKNLNLGIDVDL